MKARRVGRTRGGLLLSDVLRDGEERGETDFSVDPATTMRSSRVFVSLPAFSLSLFLCLSFYFYLIIVVSLSLSCAFLGRVSASAISLFYTLWSFTLPVSVADRALPKPWDERDSLFPRDPSRNPLLEVPSFVLSPSFCLSFFLSLSVPEPNSAPLSDHRDPIESKPS